MALEVSKNVQQNRKKEQEPFIINYYVATTRYSTTLIPIQHELTLIFLIKFDTWNLQRICIVIIFICGIQRQISAPNYLLSRDLSSHSTLNS